MVSPAPIGSPESSAPVHALLLAFPGLWGPVADVTAASPGVTRRLGPGFAIIRPQTSVRSMRTSSFMGLPESSVTLCCPLM